MPKEPFPEQKLLQGRRSTTSRLKLIYLHEWAALPTRQAKRKKNYVIKSTIPALKAAKALTKIIRGNFRKIIASPNQHGDALRQAGRESKTVRPAIRSLQSADIELGILLQKHLPVASSIRCRRLTFVVVKATNVRVYRTSLSRVCSLMARTVSRTIRPVQCVHAIDASAPRRSKATFIICQVALKACTAFSTSATASILHR